MNKYIPPIHVVCNYLSIPWSRCWFILSMLITAQSSLWYEITDTTSWPTRVAHYRPFRWAFVLPCNQWMANHRIGRQLLSQTGHIPNSKVHGTNMGPTWVLSAPVGPNVGLMNLAIWDVVDKNTRNWARCKSSQSVNVLNQFQNNFLLAMP